MFLQLQQSTLWKWTPPLISTLFFFLQQQSQPITSNVNLGSVRFILPTSHHPGWMPSQGSPPLPIPYLYRSKQPAAWPPSVKSWLNNVRRRWSIETKSNSASSQIAMVISKIFVELIVFFGFLGERIQFDLWFVFFRVEANPASRQVYGWTLVVKPREISMDWT